MPVGTITIFEPAREDNPLARILKKRDNTCEN